jgi:ABC-type nitrate/sulfonate/bicarbonate transport system substrate-binding protein
VIRQTIATCVLLRGAGYVKHRATRDYEENKEVYAMIFRLFSTALLATLILTAFTRAVHARSYIAYISDSTSSSVIYWLAKEAGIFKKHGLDLDTIFINGSVRGIQSLIAGDLGYSGAVGTAVINANLAGGDVAIIQSQMNTLPYFIIGNANIKSPEGLKGRAAAVHIPGTSADFAMRLALMKVGIPYKDIKAPSPRARPISPS